MGQHLALQLTLTIIGFLIYIPGPAATRRRREWAALLLGPYPLLEQHPLRGPRHDVQRGEARPHLRLAHARRPAGPRAAAPEVLADLVHGSRRQQRGLYALGGGG